MMSKTEVKRRVKKKRTLSVHQWVLESDCRVLRREGPGREPATKVDVGLRVEKGGR